MPKIEPGTRVFHPEYGAGVCVKVDPKSRFMRYFLKFFKESVVVWFSKDRAEELQLRDGK